MPSSASLRSSRKESDVELLSRVPSSHSRPSASLPRYVPVVPGIRISGRRGCGPSAAAAACGASRIANVPARTRPSVRSRMVFPLEWTLSGAAIYAQAVSAVKMSKRDMSV